MIVGLIGDKMAKRLVVFNHKGGVSKTTSAYNIGWMIAKDKRVLMVDADSQCNLSGLILGDSFDQYYSEAGTCRQNIKDGVAATFSGRPSPIVPVSCFAPPRNPNLLLLAGHANLSEYDAALSFAQTSNNAITTLQNLPGAFNELITLTEQKYSIDYTIIDLNPSLSAINQNLFLLANGFIIPTNPDPFSIMALDILKDVLPRWGSWKRIAVNLFSESAYPLTPGTPKFLGVLIQRFNIRKGVAAKPYKNNIQDIKDIVSGPVFLALRQAGMTLAKEQYGDLAYKQYALGEVADFQSLLPKAYAAGVPVFEVTDKEIGERGSVQTDFIERRDTIANQFADIAKALMFELNYA